MADLEQVANDLNLASQSLQELREKYDGALDLLDNKNTQITGALDSAKSDALQEIQTISDTATSQISQLKDTSLNLVNEAKNTAIKEVNDVVSDIDTSKEEALLAIEQAKVAQEEKITALEQAKENIITELSEKARLLTQNLKWTVGTGGDFTNLQDALNKASSYTPIGNYFITIMLKSGYNGSLNVSLNNVNLGFVKIDAEADLKNMQFYFDFRNVICPKFNNKIKVKLKSYSSSIYIEDEITLDTGTALESCTIIILNTLNMLCKGTTGYNQDFFFNRCQFRIKNLNIIFSGVVDSERHNGLVLWNSIGRIETINFENNINRVFSIIWSVGSNIEIQNLNGTISDQVSVPKCNIIRQERGGFVSIVKNVNMTGGNNNITVFDISSGSILFTNETSISLGNCTKSNIASNILSASGGFINK